MKEGKEILLGALEQKLNESINLDTDAQDLRDENKVLITLLNQINASKESDYQYEFIKDLSSNEIEKIVNATDKEEEDKKSYCATLLYIKFFVEEVQNHPNKESFSSVQLKYLLELRELMEAKIKSNEKVISLKQAQANDVKENYRSIKNKIDNKIAISPEDYDLIDELLSKTHDQDYGRALDLVGTYLNAYNLEILQEVPKIEKPKIRETPKVVLKTAEDKQRVKEIMSILALDFDSLDEICQNELLNISDYDKLEEFVHFIINSKFANYIKSTNVHGLCHLLANSSSSSVTTLLDALKNSYHLDDETIRGLVNRAITCFDDKQIESTINNFNLLVSHGATLTDLKDTIKDSPSFLSKPNNGYLNDVLDLLKQKGVNTQKLLTNSKTALRMGIERASENLDILEKYGFNIKEDTDFSSYCVLFSPNLAKYLDSFIEIGLNEYIHNSPSTILRTIRTEIIKRVHYAFSNGIEVFSRKANSYQKRISKSFVSKEGLNEASDEEINESLELADIPQNEVYDNLIENLAYPLSETEIKDLMVSYPIINDIEAKYAYVPEKEEGFGGVRRLTELNIGDITISRPKTYKIFKVLVENNVPEKEALLYALTYNSLLKETEYETLKLLVYGDKMGEKTL
jgi:hypothetical protein